MVFVIDGVSIRNCALEKIKIYEKDINYLIVYNYMLKYFDLKKSGFDIMYYTTYNKEFKLVHNVNNGKYTSNFYYYCREGDYSLNNIILKKYIIRDIKIKSIISDNS